MKLYTITTTTTTTTLFLLFFLHHPLTFIVFRPPPPHQRNCFTYPTLLSLLEWQLINYLFFLFTFSPPHRPHVDPTVNFNLNTASWIVKLYTITITSTTAAFLLFFLHHRRTFCVFPPPPSPPTPLLPLQPPAHFYCFLSSAFPSFRFGIEIFWPWSSNGESLKQGAHIV